jgi:hypothetical protein
MLFSPSACFGGAAAPMAWDLTRTPAAELRVLCCGDVHPFKEAQEPAPVADAAPAGYQDLDGQVARGQRVAQAASDEFRGWAKGIAGDGNNRAQAVMGSSGAIPQPRLTGPLLPRELTEPAGPGAAGPCGYVPQRLSWA